MQNVATALKEARILSGLTQQELAGQLGISAQYISDIENARRGLPDKYVERLPESIRRVVATALVADREVQIEEFRKWAY